MGATRHTPQSRARVIELFAEHGRVDLACKLAKVDRSCHYNWMRSDPDYAAAFEAARYAAVGLLEDKAKERAMSGESDRLLEFLLKGLKPEVYGDRMKSEISGPNGGPLQVATIAETLRSRRMARLEQGTEGEQSQSVVVSGE